MVAQNQDQKMTENRIMLRCACLAKVFLDSVADWRGRSGRKWWRVREKTKICCQQSANSVAVAGQKGFLATANGIMLFSQC